MASPHRSSFVALVALVGALAFAPSAAEAQSPVRVRVAAPLRPALTVSPNRYIAVSTRSTRVASRRASVRPRVRNGRAGCAITENGAPANGTVVVRRGATEVARGTCAQSFTLPAGAYTATLTLDGVVDAPTRTVPLNVRGGAAAVARASFQTSILVVTIEERGRRVPGRVALLRDGVRVGSIGSGVTSRVSAGTYDLEVRFRGRTQVVQVTLAPTQRRGLRVRF